MLQINKKGEAHEDMETETLLWNSPGDSLIIFHHLLLSPLAWDVYYPLISFLTTPSSVVG
jgi:hypothetical protein